MRLTPSRITTLIEHGLSDSEARVYLTLLDHPKLNAATLAKMTQVPRSHLYSILQDLHSTGLVEILAEDKARAYRALPLARYLRHKARELSRRLDALEKEAESVANAFVPPPLEASMDYEPGDCRLVLGRRAVAREIDEMLSAAKARVVACGTDHGSERLLRHVLPHVPQWTRSTLDLELYVPEIARAREDERCAQLEREMPGCVRTLPFSRSVLSVAVDDTSVLVVNPVPDTPDLRGGRDFGILVTSQVFVQSHVDLLRSAARPANGQEPDGSDVEAES